MASTATLSPSSASLSATTIDTLCASSYLEDVLDCMEWTPGQLQLLLSRFHELNLTIDERLKKIQLCKQDYLLAEREKDRLFAFQTLRAHLCAIQDAGDEKLSLVAQFGEILELKRKQLEISKANLEPFGSDIDLQCESAANSNKSSPRATKESSIHEEMLYQNTLKNSCTKRGVPTDTVDSKRSCSSQQTESGNNRLSGTPRCQTAATAGLAKRKRLGGNVTLNNSSLLSDKNRSSNQSTSISTKSPKKKAALSESVSNGIKRKSNSATASSNATPTTNAPASKKCSRVNQPVGGGSITSASNPNGDEDEARYCICNNVSYGDMVACDNERCPIEWFHFNCVVITARPKGKWYCPKCRGDRVNSKRPDA